MEGIKLYFETQLLRSCESFDEKEKGVRGKVYIMEIQPKMCK